ncbi:MAG: hypothetical protein COB24_11655 [Hyphomicrobiales bacterium]|nr:MAG: hypothetical protein COB24_11655 [Hyphomicrobiales bacterium]
MKRLMNEIKTGMVVQFRNGLYHVGIGVGVLVAIVVSQLISANILSLTMVGIMLLIIGGSTLLYVAAILMFERDEDTISATIVSPLTIAEYIVAKTVSLTILATLESFVSFGGALVIMYFQGVEFEIPNVLILIISLFAICIIFVLMGIILAVRYKSITDFIMPMAVVIIFLQIPIFYFVDFTDSWLLLLFPVSPPTMMMLGAFGQMQNWQYIYSIGYSVICIIGLFYWAKAAFAKHVIGE